MAAVKVAKEYFRACILGGAAADAKSYGVKESGRSLISESTQLTAFTLDGLIWADDRAIKKGVYAYIPCIFYSYQKWYYTQTGNLADKSYDFIVDGEILSWEELYARRGTFDTSLNSLGGSIENKFGTLKNRINNSNGCGSVVRVAPIGMYFWKNEEMAFRIGMESAALTHGHIDSILAAGFYASFIANIIAGADMEEAIKASLSRLKTHKNSEKCADAVTRALALAEAGTPVTKAFEELGEGYLADEAIAIASYLCLRYKNDFEGAINAATRIEVNKNGLPPMTGNALGAYLGLSAIPAKWIKSLELYELIIHGADMLLERVDIEDAPHDDEYFTALEREMVTKHE